MKMKNQVWRALLSVTMVTTIVLSGCSSISAQSNKNTLFSPMRVEAADCSYGGEIKSVEAVDEFTVKFTLCHSDVAFPAKMASPVLAVQDSDYLNQYKGDSASLSENVNGTGAFKVKQQGPEEPLQMRVSTSYWGTPPKTTDVLVDWYNEPTGPISSYELTIVDVASSLNKQAEQTISTNKMFSAIDHQPLNVIYLGFNNTLKPMDDVVVRKALATLIDTSSIVKTYFPLGSEVADQLVPSTISPGHSNLLRWYEVRPKDALDSLTAIGFDFNQELILAYKYDPADSRRIYSNAANAIKNQLQKFGLTITTKPMAPSDFDRAMTDGTEMMFLNRFDALYVDAAAFYELPFVRDTVPFGSPYSELQQLLLQAQAEQSSMVRQTKFDELNQKFKDLVPMIPIGHVMQRSYVRSGDSNALANAFYENYEDMSNLSHTIQILEARRPVSLWPADETDMDTFRITRLLYDTLVENSFGGNDLTPALADSWDTNSDATEWTFFLRYNVKFSNDASLDANDVVASFAAIWDASSENHTGRTGEFVIFKQLFGGFINAN